MRTLAWMGMMLALLCAGCDAESPADDDAGTEEPMDAGARADAGPFDAGSFDAGPETDGGGVMDDGGDGADTGPGVDGGDRLPPGVACAADTCTGGEICCARPTGGGACLDRTMADTCGGIVIACDGPEDCMGREVCCAGRDADSLTGSRCVAAMACQGATQATICHDADDCATGQMCCPGASPLDGFCAETCPGT